jgi:hypothetical protein
LSGSTPNWGGGNCRCGLTGFYVQFLNGLIFILALIEHRWNQARYR